MRIGRINIVITLNYQRLDWQRWRMGCLCALLVASNLSPSSAATLGWNADALLGTLREHGKLTPDDRQISPITFQEFFRTPIGPGGLEYTDKLRGLDGKQVRILGFMVHQEESRPGSMILAPFALATEESEYGLCDDLPPSVVFVAVPGCEDKAVPFTRGPLLLTGRLELGARTEADGRVSHVRLVLNAASQSAGGVISTQPVEATQLSSIHEK